MSQSIKPTNPLQHLWQVLDGADLWQEGAAAEQTQLALAALEQRVQRAGQRGVAMNESNYLSFLRRSASCVAQPAMARAG